LIAGDEWEAHASNPAVLNDISRGWQAKLLVRHIGQHFELQAVADVEHLGQAGVHVPPLRLTAGVAAGARFISGDRCVGPSATSAR